MQKANLTTSRVKNAKNANTTFLLKGRGSGKVLAAQDYIDKLKKENPNIKIVIIRKKDLQERNNKNEKRYW